MKVRRFASCCVLGSIVFALGCGSAGSDGAEASDSSWVERPVFERMNAVVRRIAYLPFGYPNGGCHGRALYMAMELAAEGLESNVVFAFANGAALQYPRPSGGWIGWSYHVAPLLNVGPDAEHLTPMVLDPALAPEPLTRTDWIAKMGFAPGAPHYPRTLMVPGSVYAPDNAKAEVEWRDRDMPDFAHLPPFRASDVQDACAVMYRNLQREPSSSTALPSSTKREMLLRRTEELLMILEERRKLTRDTDFSTSLCQKAS